MANETQKVVIKTAGSSFPILGLLGVCFVVLKLTGHITWPWIWVLAPFWGPWVFALLVLLTFFLVCGLLLGVAYLVDKFPFSKK